MAKECSSAADRRAERSFLPSKSMFARQNRLSRDDLAKVSKAGKSINTNLFSLKTLPEKVSKFAFVASKKECGGSVDRNKAKRRARAAMRHIPLSSPIWCVVFLKKAVLKAPFDAIVLELRKALNKYV
jgi:ribonuclease P protein component